jgi:hypothetical protein
MKQALAGYVLLNRFINWDTSETKVGLRTLGATGGVDPETIQRWAKHLENLGLIKITPGDSTNPTTYLILMPPFPPPEHILKEYYPEGWTPPGRTKATLEKVQFFINFGSTPQSEGGLKKGVGTMPTPPTPKMIKEPTDPSVGITPTPSTGEVSASNPQGVGIMPTERRDFTEDVSASRPQYKQSLTNSNKETNNNVVQVLLLRLTKDFQAKDPTATVENLQNHYEECLECCDGNSAEAVTYLEEKIRVVLAMKEPKNPQAVLTKAIKEDWKSTTKKPSGAALAEYEKRRKEAAELEKQVQKEKEIRKSAAADEILDYFKTLPANVFALEKRLKFVEETYEGNPVLGETLEKIKKSGDNK